MVRVNVLNVELLWTLTIALALLGVLLGASVSFLLTRAHYQAIIEELKEKLPG